MNDNCNYSNILRKTTVDSLDEENILLLEASDILQEMTDLPGITVAQLCLAMTDKGIDIEDERSQELLTACISIETMMAYEISYPDGIEATIH